MLVEIWNNEKGITRLMVATMLIACLAVAGLVAWVTFSPEQEGQPFYAASASTPSLQLSSAVLAQADDTGVQEVSFVLGIAEGAPPVNLTMPPENVVTVSYRDDRTRIEDVYWNWKPYGPQDGDAMLEAGERAKFTVCTPGPGPGASFEVLVKTPDGKVLPIARVIPDELTPVMNLQ